MTGKAQPSKSAGPSSQSAERTTPFDAIEATFVGAVASPNDYTTLPVASIEVAFAGRSNVGKSSLINTLVSRKNLVRTSNTPGCTRQINFFSVRARDGQSHVLVDLPGYGFAKRSKSERSEWAALIEGYLGKRSSLRAVVLLVDARRGIEEDDQELIQFIAATRGKRAKTEPLAVVVVATKFDKVQSSKRASVKAALAREAGFPIIAFSSETRDGYQELWRAIRAAIATPPATAAADAPMETSRAHEGEGPEGRVAGAPEAQVP